MARLAHNPEVVCTELEEGAVFLNLQTGLYYSLNTPALAVWNLAGGSDIDELVAAAAGRFDAPAETTAPAIEKLIRELEVEGLLVADEGDAGPNQWDPAPDAGEPLPFSEPQLIRHEEPLHEVNTHPLDAQLPLAE